METEIPFIILSNNFEDVSSIIKQVIECNKYEPILEGTIDIRDRYYDTEDIILNHNHINLRIRSTNNKNPVVTLKYPGESKTDYSNRFEIEESWSSSIYETIRKKLESTDIGLDISSFNYHEDPESAFRNIGLTEIMKKFTQRTLINAMIKETESTEFEFALDRVSIDVKNQNSVKFYELEIESKRQGNQTKLKEFATMILESTLFERWAFNKLDTGLAIIYLMNNNRLEKSSDLDIENYITRAGLEKIKKHLEKA